MFGNYPVAEIGALLADPSRVAILTLLLDGRLHSAGDLAAAANLSPQAASAHLSKLTGGGLLRVIRVGRRRLFELARPEVGHALESLGAATRHNGEGGTNSKADASLRFARTCYDHLAGQVAVHTARRLVARGVILVRSGEYVLPASGEQWFAEQGIDVRFLRRQRRVLTRRCVDWTEREPHLGGALGAAWLSRCVSARWISRRPDTRAVRITDLGGRRLRELLGLDISAPL